MSQWRPNGFAGLIPFLKRLAMKQFSLESCDIFWIFPCEAHKCAYNDLMHRLHPNTLSCPTSCVKNPHATNPSDAWEGRIWHRLGMHPQVELPSHWILTECNAGNLRVSPSWRSGRQPQQSPLWDESITTCALKEHTVMFRTGPDLKMFQGILFFICFLCLRSTSCRNEKKGGIVMFVTSTDQIGRCSSIFQLNWHVCCLLMMFQISLSLQIVQVSFRRRSFYYIVSDLRFAFWASQLKIQTCLHTAL